MLYDTKKIYNVYERNYKFLFNEMNEEKESFYFLNDILIFIFLQNVYEDNLFENCVSIDMFQENIQRYETDLGIPLFFKKYNLSKIDINIFTKVYISFYKILNHDANLSSEEIQEVLGYVLEKHINRRKTGSYYTPHDTTNYITNYSIFISVYKKLENRIQKKIIKEISLLIGHGKIETEIEDIIKEHVDLSQLVKIIVRDFSSKELSRINDAINSLKIIDPTCGSGAFVITAFDYLFYLKKCIISEKNFVIEEEMSNILQILHGVDISSEAISLLKMRLIIKIISKSPMIELFDEIFINNFKLHDAFNGPDFIIAPRNIENEFDWRTFGYQFDCIIGNPPYVESKNIESTNFVSKKCGNLYAYTIERGYNILNEGGIIAFIVPLSLISTQRMEKIREYMITNSSKIFFASFADRPGCIFKGVHQRLTIFFASKRNTGDCKIFSSKYNFWYNDERVDLFKNIKYLENNDPFFPKIGLEVEKSIFSKVKNSKNDLLFGYLNKSGEHVLYLSTRIGLWTKCFLKKPNSSEIREIRCINSDEKHIYNAFYNSSTFYFMWILISDCWHITGKDISRINFSHESISIKDKKRLIMLSEKLSEDLEINKKFINTKQVDYEYKHKLSKNIIDEIDEIIGKSYGFNAEEIEYVKKYAFDYRMNTVVQRSIK